MRWDSKQVFNHLPDFAKHQQLEMLHQVKMLDEKKAKHVLHI